MKYKLTIKPVVVEWHSEGRPTETELRESMKEHLANLIEDGLLEFDIVKEL